MRACPPSMKLWWRCWSRLVEFDEVCYMQSPVGGAWQSLLYTTPGQWSLTKFVIYNPRSVELDEICYIQAQSVVLDGVLYIQALVGGAWRSLLSKAPGWCSLTIFVMYNPRLVEFCIVRQWSLIGGVVDTVSFQAPTGGVILTKLYPILIRGHSILQHLIRILSAPAKI